MFKNVKKIIERTEVKELLGYAVMQDPLKEEQALQAYRTTDEWQLYGYEDDGLVVGIIGFEEQADDTIRIRHIAVLPENRYKGYARGMLLTLIQEHNPKQLTAEADGEGVDFFRNVGFAVYGSEDTKPEQEAYHCIYEIDEE